MIKIFVYLYSLFILSLALISCSDKTISVDSDLVNIALSQENSDDHNDYCSPFCACTCCKTTVVFSVENGHIEEPIIDNLLDKSFPFFNENPHLTEPINIWQPPKLS